MSSYRSFYTAPSIPHPSIAQSQQHDNCIASDGAHFLSAIYQSISPLPTDEYRNSIGIVQNQRPSLQTRIDSFMHNDYSAIEAERTYHDSQITQNRQQSPLGAINTASIYPVGTSTIYSFPSWSSMYDPENTYNSMGLETLSPFHGLRRQGSHQRTPSASTIASSGPRSPYNNNSTNPQIANTDYDPEYNQGLSKYLSVAGNTAFLSADYSQGHSDMKGFAIDSNPFIEDISTPSSGGLSLSSMEDQPLTPGNMPEEADVKQNKNEFRPFIPAVQLTRTESAVYQDELYNPANVRVSSTRTAKSAKPQAPTSNAHRTLVNQRLESANQARSTSPTSHASRDRSPFIEGSSLAPATSMGGVWNASRAAMNTSASRAQKLQEEREEVERAAIRRPQLQREPTKTISPKDALLDYNENGDQPSLFQDSVPLGYKQHLSGNEILSNSYLAQQQNPTFTLPPSGSQTSMAGFRAAGAADAYSNADFNFTQPALPASTTATTTSMPSPFQLNNYQQLSHLAPSYPAAAANIDATPDFPAHLTSMESSISEGPPMSSQESSALATLQRPADTRANTGTYTCTYHGCAQRFESPASLQRHKREYHRSQQQPRDSPSVTTASASPRSTTESPGPTSNSGLTSAQILARNSQAGPHKCTRINPSTGKPCNTIFSRPYDLTRHEDTIHNGRKQKVRCPYCREEKTFSRNDALTRHMRVVHPDIENYGKRGRRGD